MEYIYEISNVIQSYERRLYKFLVSLYIILRGKRIYFDKILTYKRNIERDLIFLSRKHTCNTHVIYKHFINEIQDIIAD